MFLHRVLPAIGLVLVAASAPAADPTSGKAVSLFNGKDLTGWVNVNGAPGTFYAKNGEIVTTGTPTGFLRTEKQYENFIVEFDWMHVEKTKTANSGMFVWGDALPAIGTPYTRGIEVQVLINYPKVDWATNHGDIFAIWGAVCKPDRPHPKGAMRCLPSENRVKGGGEWNHYKIIAKDGVIKLHVNGKEVSGVSNCNPRKGYLALESEGVECHFKNIMIQELPSTNPKPNEIAALAEGHVNIFTGLNLDGWKAPSGSWKAGGGVLTATGKAPILSAKEFGAGELLFDYKRPAKSTDKLTISHGSEQHDGSKGKNENGWTRVTIPLKGSSAPIGIEAPAGIQLRSIYFKAAK